MDALSDLPRVNCGSPGGTLLPWTACVQAKQEQLPILALTKKILFLEAPNSRVSLKMVLSDNADINIYLCSFCIIVGLAILSR